MYIYKYRPIRTQFTKPLLLSKSSSNGCSHHMQRNDYGKSTLKRQHFSAGVKIE